MLQERIKQDPEENKIIYLGFERMEVDLEHMTVKKDKKPG